MLRRLGLSNTPDKSAAVATASTADAVGKRTRATRGNTESNGAESGKGAGRGAARGAAVKGAVRRNVRGVGRRRGGDIDDDVDDESEEEKEKVAAVPVEGAWTKKEIAQLRSSIQVASKQKIQSS
jgi:hypothetical protein